ncbi:MAG: hypothetical protein JXA28_05695 [Bacteroidetes bacterium]|nr:hypothetical protein [Bacteroidota bacterium]
MTASPQRMLLPLRVLPFLLATAILVFLSACDEATSPDTQISVHITQPQDSQVVRDTVLRILTEISTNCGCQAHVEFHIDGKHQYSDYLPFYSYDWDIRGITGTHVIATRVVVTNRGDAWDSVRVFVNP